MENLMMPPQMPQYDVVIAGGGPAGLQAAMTLGRARRKVLLCDTGEPRNAPAEQAHNVFTRDGTPPGEILRIAREQLAPYDSVESRFIKVVGAQRTTDGFLVSLGDGRQVAARKLVLATGIRDLLPAVEGMRELWGHGVFHCPYCHAFELGQVPLGVYGHGADVVQLATMLTAWSDSITVFTDHLAGLSSAEHQRLAANGIKVYEGPIARLEPGVRVVMADGEVVDVAGLFIRPAFEQRTTIPSDLSCELNERGLVMVNEEKESTVPGLYVVGDPSTQLQSVSIAAATGATAAIAINVALANEDADRRLLLALAGEGEG